MRYFILYVFKSLIITIQTSKTSSTQGVTLSNLTFYGEYVMVLQKRPP